MITGSGNDPKTKPVHFGRINLKKKYEAVLSLELEHCLLNYLNMSENRNNENFLLLKQILHKLQNCYKTRNKLR